MAVTTEVRLRWVEDEVFEILHPKRAGSFLDGNRQQGLSPMESLLTSVAGCMGIDVVMILLKMRAPLEGIEIQARGHRMEDPPRYFHKLEFDFLVRGGVREKDINRAIELSFEKYCSVFHSLRPGLEIERRVLEG